MSISTSNRMTNGADSSRAFAGLPAGLVWINGYSVFDAAMSFGGYKESGWGREMGHNALDNYLETKSVVTQLA